MNELSMPHRAFKLLMITDIKKLNIEKHGAIGGLDLPGGRELKEEEDRALEEKEWVVQ